MADNLIFPIGFDLEKGVKDAQAQMDSVLRRLQKTADGKPLTIPMSLDSSKFTTFEAALRGSIQHITDDAKNLKAALDSSLQTDNSANINRITEAMRSLEAAWKALPNNQKFDINDRLTPKAQEMVRQFNELATASNTYGQTLSQIAGKIKRVADEEAKANQMRNDGYAKLRKTLGAQENSIANLSAKIKAYQQILNSKEIGSKSFERVAEKIRKLTEQLDKAKTKVTELTGKVKPVSHEFKNQETYVSRLIKRLAVYASFSMVGNFLAKIREVTAEFELQRVSLGAIIQDQAKANMLFSEIKAFALKSPVSILDLTKYTKQLAAYKVGWNGVTTDVKELFDWTKRLTDVSVGLGVSMDRVVLAFGQVRATGYLRASEVRQFTEMGVPIVEELAAKLSKLNGEAVTAADVMDMISKRGISFEMVKDVFDDMTSAGGMFYNMQEKQGNTLYGLWAKLGDAASVMYDEIGNTGWVNQAMKGLIQGVTDVMKHWGSWAKLIGIVGTAYLANAGALKLLSLVTLRYTAAGAKLVGISKAKVLAAEAEAKATRNAGFMAQWGARRDLALALAKYKAATATNVLSASLHRLWAAFLANPLGWIIAIVGAAIAIFDDFDNTLDNLQGKLSEINEKYTLKNMRDGDNFRRLADGAVKAANGSKEQRDKLEELDRTYGKIVGSENLQIDRLRAMTDGYASLVQQVKEYNLQMEHQEREGEIKSFYGEKKKSAYGEWVDELSNLGFAFTGSELGSEAGAAIATNVQTALLDEIAKNGRATVLNANNILEQQIKQVFLSRGFKNIAALEKTRNIVDRLKEETAAYVEALNVEQAALDAETARYEKAGGKLAQMRKEIETANNALAEYSLYIKGEGYAAEDSFAFQQGQANAAMKYAADLIRNSKEYKDALGDKAKEMESEWLHYVDKFDLSKIGDITSINFEALLKVVGDGHGDLKARIRAIQQEWGNLSPTDATVIQIRTKLIDLSASFDPALDKMKKYLWDGSGTVDEYLKKLREQQDALKTQLKKWQTTILNWSFVSALRNGMSKEQLQQKIDDAKKELEALNALVPFVTTYTNEKDKNKGRGSRQDPRLQNLKEEISLYEKLYQEYQQYEKAVGSSKAVEYMNREAKETIDTLAGKYGIGLPKSAKDLTSALEILYKKMEALPPKVFKNLDKELKEFKWKIEKVDIDASQKSIEAELKRLADRISRTKTAKEFYEKILGMTGDVELAANIGMQIYGGTGRDLNEQIKEQFTKAFAGINNDHADLMPEVTDIINRGAYEELRDYIEMLPEAQRKAAEDLVKAQQQMSVKQYEQWLKDLEKAKDYADKRIELSRYTANQIAAIEQRIAKLDPAASDYEQQKAMLEKLIAGYKSREDKEAAALDYEQFKNSALYVQVFENLDNASKTALENMRSRLLSLKDQWKNLSPEKVKELTKRLEELDAQIAQRNPFKSLADSMRKLTSMRKNGRTKDDDAQKAFDAEENRKAARDKMIADEKSYEAAVNQYGAESDIAKEKRKIADASAETYRKSEKAADDAAENAEEWEDVAESIQNANQKLDKYQEQVNEALDGIRGIMESFGASEEDLQFFDDAVGGLNQIFDAGQQGAEAYASFMAGDFVGAATKGISAVSGLISGVTNLFYAGRVRRANKEIKKQKELLEQLEYTYGRLEKAADKVFGRDYVNNYNQQLKNLQAQQRAYEKQAQAERSKGKKEDKEKTKEYLDNAREVADQIKDLQADLAAHFAGSSKTDVARQMAQSWIEARSSMSDTFAAIKDDYKEMIRNMIVEGAAARVIENALTPMWDSMEKMLAGNDVDGAIDAMINGMDSALNAANNGMEVLWKALEARGYDMKQLISDTDSEYTGIAKNVAGASSEEILQLSGFVNTALYYVSPIPRIDENLARVVALMEGGGAVTTTSNATGWTDWQQQAMDNYMAIARNTAETVVRCERAAVACEKMASAITSKGAVRGLNVFMH